jgi:hypothetical protein
MCVGDAQAGVVVTGTRESTGLRGDRTERRAVHRLIGCAVVATATLLTPGVTAEAHPAPGSENGASSRFAPAAATAAQIADLSLSAGRLRYIDTGVDAEDAQGSVWQRTVGRDSRNRPVLATASRMLAISAATGPQSLVNRRPVLSTSAGRAVVQQFAAVPTTLLPYAVVDRGVITQTFSSNARNGFRIRASGPYSVVERRVHRVDGTVALDLTQAVHTDLYGSSVIYSRADGSVRVRDLSRAVSAGNPRLLAAARCDAGCAGQVAIWGSTVAWTRKDTALLVRTLPATKVRVVKPLTNVFDLRLSEGVLSWHTADDALKVVNLRSARSSARTVALTGAEVDDHLVAGITDTGALAVQALPFGQATAYRPRLIGALGSSGFSPDGDGVRDLWVPQFDLSKPVGPILVTLTRNGDVVRTLTASGPDGSVRDVAWDGRNEFGIALPAGAYRWRLDAKARDGDGTLTAVNGVGPATGTLALSR